jgi:hypothetical protein
VVAEAQISDNKPNEEEGENPILVAQRYLNIFHQIHIFPPEKKAEFDISLKNMPKEIRHILPTIPGGRILMDHILELEGKKKKTYDDEEVPNEKENETPATQQPAITNAPIIANGKISLDPDFAKNLAGSLAIAFRNNNLMPGGNLNELSNVLSKSFSAYADNMQQMTQTILSQNMEQLNKSQTELHTQITKQLNVQTELQNRITEKVGNQISQVQSQLNTQISKQLDWQNKMQSQFEQNLQLQNQLQQKINSQISTKSTSSVATESVAGSTHAAAQMNAQTNNANTTTINNINVDSSCFNGLSQTIRETEEKRSADFQKIIEVLNKNFAHSHNQKSQEFPVTAITNSITEALRESSKQQLAAIKAFGETLSQTIRQSQQELAKTLSKNNPQPEKIYITQAAPLPPIAPVKEEKITHTETDKNNSQNNQKKEQNRDNRNKKNEIKNESITDKSAQHQVEPKKNQPSKEAKQPQSSSKIKKEIKTDEAEDADFISAFITEPEKKQNDISLEDIFTDIKDTRPLNTTSSEQKTTEISPKTKVEEKSPVKPENIVNTEPKPKPELKANPKVEPTPPPKPKIHSHLYDDAMSKIKAALQSSETVSLNDLDDVSPVSLSGETVGKKPQEPETEYTDTPFDDSLLDDFLEENSEADNNNEEWEYVDENGNQISADDSEEWEYVDEDGNPVEADGSEEWEYVDEDGNPVEADGSEEWEYVDEDGNPVEADGSEEWEYVDEDGNPISSDDTEEWEYVDEDGNPIDDNDIKENDLTSAFLASEEPQSKEDAHDK